MTCGPKAEVNKRYFPSVFSLKERLSVSIKLSLIHIYNIRTLFARLPQRLSRLYTIPLGNIVFRQYNTVSCFYVTAHRYGLTSDFRIVQAFDGGVKIIHVDV